MHLTHHFEQARYINSDESSRTSPRPPQLSSHTKDAIVSGLSNHPVSEPLGDFGEEGFVIRGILDEEACECILQDSQVRIDPTPDQQAGDSVYTMLESERIADTLWTALEPVLRPKQHKNDNPLFTDRGIVEWEPVGISPNLHLIQTGNDLGRESHYGCQPDFTQGRCVLKNVFINLTPGFSNVGGCVRLMLDTHRWMPFDEREFSSQSYSGFEQDVLVNVHTKQGDCLLLDWDILRSGWMWNPDTNSGIVLQANILYEKVAGWDSDCSASETTLPHPSTDYSWLDRTYRRAVPVIGDSIEALADAGWFDDGLAGEHEWDPRWWTGPIDKITINLSKLDDPSRKLAVLFSTGGFCPIHEGHIRTMERAKAAIEETGVAVLGGYLCPDHDDYVSAKCGDEAISFDERLQLCCKAVAESDWLMADRSAALTTNVNFTRVADHISRRMALEIRTHRPIHIIYVFGGDNARFTQAFIRRGACICVMRKGCDDIFDKFATSELLQHNPRVMFTWNDAPLVSSTAIRRGDISALPVPIQTDWARIQNARQDTTSRYSEPVNLCMRDEGLWAVLPWKDLGFDWRKIANAHAIFRQNLKEAFTKAYARMQPAVELLVTPLETQRSIYEQKFTNAQVISLDACLPGTANFQISRRYTPLSQASHGYGPRPGAPPLEEQIRAIVPGIYDLFDDDCFSGRTKDFAIAQLTTECTIRDFHTLCDSEGPLGLGPEDGPFRARLDNVDCRDYLIGCRDGGLVLQLSDGSICRAPYVLPYVSPHVRSSMPAVSEVGFSRTVWVLNRDFFASLDRRMCVADMSPAFKQLCRSMRFGDDESMVAVCEWHIKRLV